LGVGVGHLKGNSIESTTHTGLKKACFEGLMIIREDYSCVDVMLAIIIEY
jgi:hypothetical protein